MTVYLATRTLSAIEDTIRADQGASYRKNLGMVIPHIGDAYRSEPETFRTHMGASLIGGECPRAIWYGFHWSSKSDFSGRLMRLFNRGHLEEARMIAILLTIGCQVFQQDEHGKQFRISDHGGHFGGSGDGVAIGIPDLPPGTAALLEFKTHNDKSFKKLKEVGVREAKPEHFIQMQIYLRKMGLTVALYMSVNKNDDELYAELVFLDTSVGDQYIDRAGKIIFMKQAPDKINESAGYFKCKWCDSHRLCHMRKMPERNCRTCAYAEPRPDGTWVCQNQDRQVQLLFPATNPLNEDFTLTKERQLAACDHYEVNSTYG